MPKKRPHGLPKRLKKTELTIKTKVLSALAMAVATAKAMMIEKGVITGQASTGGKAETDLAVLCKSALNEMAGLEAEAVIVLMTSDMTAAMPDMIAGMPTIITIRVKIRGAVAPPVVAPQARLDMVALTPGVFQNQRLQMSAQT